MLIATDYYRPFIGGAQIQSRLLAHNLRDRGHDVVVATVAQRGLPRLELDDDIPVHRLRHLRTVFQSRQLGQQSHHPPFPDPVTVVGLRRLIRQFKPDVVQSYGWISYSCAAALVRTDIPLLLTARDYGYACANRTLLQDGHACSGPALAKCLGCAGRNYGRPKGWLAVLGVFGSRGLLRRRTRALQCISEYVLKAMRRDFLQRRPPAFPSFVIHDVINGVVGAIGERDDPRRVETYLSQLPQEPYILFVGALRQAKGVWELLAAYELLESPPPLVLMGTYEPDGPRSFPPGVHVVADAPHAVVLAAWERALFGVMPSLLPEPLGSVVLEAMSAGKAVIGSEPGGHTDMISPRETGLLVPRADVHALAAAMEELLADGDLRERLGRAAARRSAQFTAEAVLPRLEEELAKLVPGSSPDGAPAGVENGKAAGTKSRPA